MNKYNSSLNIGGGNSNYNIIRTPSKTEFDNLVINSDLNGTLNSDFNTRKINAWNYCVSSMTSSAFVDFSAFQDNTNNTSTRCNQNWSSGPIYINCDKDFHISVNDGYNNIEANFRPIIEYRE